MIKDVIFGPGDKKYRFCKVCFWFPFHYNKNIFLPRIIFCIVFIVNVVTMTTSILSCSILLSNGCLVFRVIWWKRESTLYWFVIHFIFWLAFEDDNQNHINQWFLSPFFNFCNKSVYLTPAGQIVFPLVFDSTYLNIKWLIKIQVIYNILLGRKDVVSWIIPSS